MRGISGEHIGQLPCIRHQGPTDYEGLTPTIGTDLALSLLYGSKIILPSSAWSCHSFLHDSDTKTQWAEVFGVPFLVSRTVLIFAILHVVGVFPWHWFPWTVCYLALPI